MFPHSDATYSSELQTPCLAERVVCAPCFSVCWYLDETPTSFTLHTILIIIQFSPGSIPYQLCFLPAFYFVPKSNIHLIISSQDVFMLSIAIVVEIFFDCLC